MKQKQEKRYLQKRIEGIEGAISVHQSAIDYDETCEEDIKYRQEAIEELSIELEAFRHYLNSLNNPMPWTSDKHGHCNFIKYLYRSEGYHIVKEYIKCSECGKKSFFVNKDWNFCPNCGIKLDGSPQFFRKKTYFVEGEEIVVSISREEYERADEWEYEIGS